VAFFERYFTHAKGELGGKPFALEPWQRDYVRALFAEENGQRKIRTSLLALPRKNGKSSLCAGIALRLLLEDEPGCEVYSCAASRDQARLVFDMARIAVEQSPILSQHLTVYRSAIVRDKTHGTYKALSAEAGIQHGLSAHGVIFDELHVSNREMWEVMLSSQGARRQPLTVALTTAGYDRKSVCWEVWQYAEAVKAGSIKDERFLPAIYSASIEDDWKDERTWAKANPNLGVSVKLDFLRSECARAVEMPSYENSFRQLFLNQWTQQDQRWLRMDHWMQGAQPCPVDLRARECFGGLDLATTFDTTCLALVFPLEDGTVWCEPHFWIPEENMRQRVQRDKVQYDVWARQGHLHLTHGNVTDYDQVRAEINELTEKYNIRQIAIDRWNATQLATQLQGDGIDVVGFGQGYGSMSAPAKQLEAMVVSAKLLHNNPVLDWQAGNVAIQQDHAGNIKPSKQKSTERIDGIVSLVMALGIMAKATTKPEAKLGHHRTMSDLADYRMYDLRSVDWTASSNRTPSGVRVTADNSMACSAYTACIRVISDAVSSLPLHLYEKLPDGGKVKVSSHPLYRLLHTQPNPWQTAQEFRDWMTGMYLHYGASYAEIRPGARGAVSELWPLHSSRMEVERLSKTAACGICTASQMAGRRSTARSRFLP
jgi:phage terminase large subunit-like protein